MAVCAASTERAVAFTRSTAVVLARLTSESTPSGLISESNCVVPLCRFKVLTFVAD